MPLPPIDADTLREMNVQYSKLIAQQRELAKATEEYAAIQKTAGILPDDPTMIAAERKVRIAAEEVEHLKQAGAERHKAVEAANAEYAEYERIFDTEKDRAILREVEDKKKKVAEEREKDVMTWQLANWEDLSEVQKEAGRKRKKVIELEAKMPTYLREAKELSKAIGDNFNAYGSHPLFNTANMIKVVGSMRNLKAFGKGLAVSIGTGMLDSFINLIFQLNKAEAEFYKTTRASKEFTTSMRDVYAEVRANVVTIDTFYKNVTALSKTFTDFTLLSPAAAGGIAKITSTMEAAGHEGSNLAKTLQILTANLGMMPHQTKQTLLELDAFAEDIKMPPGQITEQFAAMGAGLAKLGTDAVGAFKDLARVSKITGFEMQKLLNMTDKFDTFEGAAKQAGQLNAALGGNFVNAMELMTATDPIQRFEMLRDSLGAAGLEFDNMSYYQRLFFKESLGLESVGDLAAMMRGDLESLDLQIGTTAADYERLALAAKKSADFQKRFQAIIQKLIPIFSPLLEGIDMLLMSVDELTESSGNYTTKGQAMHKVLLGFVTPLKELGQLILYVAKNWKWALGIFLLFKGIGFLGPLLFTIVGGASALGTMLTALRGKVVAAAADLAILVGVALGLGLAWKWAGEGIGVATEGMAKLFTAIDVDKLLALGAFIASAAFSGFGLAIAGAGLLTFAGGLYLLNGQLEDMPLDILNSFNTFLHAVNNMGDSATLSPLITQLRTIRGILDEMPEVKTVAVAAMFEAMAYPAARAAAAAVNVGGGGGTAAAAGGRIHINATIPVYLDGKQIASKTWRHYQDIERENDNANARGQGPVHP